MNHLHSSRPRRPLYMLLVIIVGWGTSSAYTSSLLQPVSENQQANGCIKISLTKLFVPLFLLRLFYFVSNSAPGALTYASPGEQTLILVERIAPSAFLGAAMFSGILAMFRLMDSFSRHFPLPFQNTKTISFFKGLQKGNCLALALAPYDSALIGHQIRGHDVWKRMLPKRP